MKPQSDAFPTDEELVAHLFGDADDPAAVEAALAESAELRRTFEELRRTLDLVDAEPVPPRSAEYGAEVFRQIEGRLDGETSRVLPFRRRAQRVRQLGLAAAAVLLLGVGFFLGRLGGPAVTPPPAQVADASGLSEEARNRLLTVALTRHLGQSERLLTDFVNASEAPMTDAELERVWAAELLASNRLYRRAAEEAGQRRIAGLLAELEPVLLELAHAEDAVESGVGERTELRRRVDDRGLLFKVRVTERRLESQPRPTPISL
ncbi:MAG: hypothetical protein AAFX50_04350 [Acidobacteriota bacterium]